MNNQHPPAILVADSPGLDFLNSIATPSTGPLDWIGDGAGLLSWLEEARFVPREALDALCKQAKPAELDEVAARARELREWFRGFVKRTKGRPLTAKDLSELAPLNRLLERDEGYGEIVVAETSDASGTATPLAWRATRRWRSPDSLLLPIAEALAKLVCEEDFSQVKACEGPHCTLLFADHTRGHGRRWCSMAMCGNRAKVAAHRRRQKEQAAN